MLKFLTVDPQQIANNIGVPSVTTHQMTDKVNGVFSQIYQFLNGWFMNFAVICLIIAIIGLLISAVFHKKGLKFFGVAIVIIGLSIILFENAPNLVGWFVTMSK